MAVQQETNFEGELLVSMIVSTENEGKEGYDFHFVDPGPTDDQKCPICFLVARDAYQVNCCGQIFCHNCLMKHKQYSRWCPLCRENIGNRYFKDTKSNRNIKNLKVYCTFKDEGCSWNGELRQINDHSQNCCYRKVNCIKCDATVKQIDLETHILCDCPFRSYTCPLCSKEGPYISLTEDHRNECPEADVICKNKGCEAILKRCELYQHLKICPKEIVNCPYNDIGCKTKIKRQNVDMHVEANNDFHFSKIVQKVQELQLGTCPTVIKFTNFGYHKTLGMKWFSPGFYTGPGGYKIRLIVYADGDGDGEGTHLSVFANLLIGDFDETIEWPMKGQLHIELLNQKKNRNHYKQTVTFDHNATKECLFKKQEEDEVGWGKTQFISNSFLSYNPNQMIQFLKDDCVYFRVTADIHSMTKPWLAI